eukprot:TRINITY_DN6290_c0_g1_i6.p1 TRINITY_DN6290_c0_g1~~TRINITY_DN6290_c0_g1_i6.p1  ORF type:complete len:943 (+),score=244.55 TRINITY_DN6290_c0_g1_i6:31-2859(+)
MKIAVSSLVIWLVLCGLVYSGPMGRKKRDAKAIERGHNWFKSFYSMFSPTKEASQPTSKLGVTPSTGGGDSKIEAKKADPLTANQQQKAAGRPQKPVGGGQQQQQKAVGGGQQPPKFVVEEFFPTNQDGVAFEDGEVAEALPPTQAQVLNMAYDVSQLDNQVESIGGPGNQGGFLVQDLEEEVHRDMSDEPVPVQQDPTYENQHQSSNYFNTNNNYNSQHLTNNQINRGVDNSMYNNMVTGGGYNGGGGGYLDPYSALVAQQQQQNMYGFSGNYLPTYEYDPYTQTYYASSSSAGDASNQSPFYNDYNMPAQHVVSQFQDNPMEGDPMFDNFFNKDMSDSIAEEQTDMMTEMQDTFDDQRDSIYDNMVAYGDQQEVGADQTYFAGGEVAVDPHYNSVPGAYDNAVPSAYDTPVPSAYDTAVPGAYDTAVPATYDTAVPSAYDTAVSATYDAAGQLLNAGAANAYDTAGQMLNDNLITPDVYGVDDSGAQESVNYSEPSTDFQGELDGLELSTDSASASLESALPDLFNYDIYSAFTDAVSNSENAKTAIPPVIVGESSVPPNKAAHPGIPNKTAKEIIDYEGDLGFSLVGPSVRMPKEECLTNAGGIGECLQAFECGLEGGKPDGLCHLGHDAYYHLRVCCVYESFCGFETNKEVTYLKNPEFPQYTHKSSDCMLKIDLLPNVCQVRLDFLELEMKPMEDGECDPNNSLYISTSVPDAYVPVKQLCGTIHREIEDELRTDIPHVYVHVNRDHPNLYGGPDQELPNKDDVPSLWLTLKVDDFASRWNIRVSQIQCDGANLQAPAGCAQYYNMNSGNITSFNLLDRAYQKDLSMTSCIKRDPAACALELNMKTFFVGETRGGSGKLGYGLTCKDYFLVNGEKTSICGSNNNIPRKLIFPSHGPQSIFFHSDSEHDPKTDIGYHFEYFHHTNCQNLEYYKYPNKK